MSRDAAAGRDVTSVRWQPSASRAALELRARLLTRVREFFAQRGVLEVETPALGRHAVTDVNLAAAEVSLPGFAGKFHLHTSPEYAMKRLLASGSGDIWQSCRVFRGGERGRLHNPEFTLIEWYRIGFSMDELMDEAAALVQHLLGTGGPARPVERLTYATLLGQQLGLDVLEADLPSLARAAGALGCDAALLARLGRDELLDLLMGERIGPALGRGRLSFVERYPASQAALARLDPQDPRVALRFELYCEGLELANGFAELGAADEQRARFEADRCSRQRRGLPVPAVDEALLAALAAGLPDCAGVALGFDRVVMLAAGAAHIDEVLAFPIERA